LSLAVAPFAANMLPYKAYEIENGKNYEVAGRSPIQAEILGLTVATLVFPVVDHKVGKLKQLSNNYASTSLVYNESNDATLGIIGAIGFVFLLIVLILQRHFSNLLVRLSQFNLVALLLSTTGGFGVIFAYVISPQIRAYNRISMFIAAMSFIAIALVLTRYINKMGNTKQVLFMTLSVFILSFGVFDLVSSNMNLQTNQKNKIDYLSDQQFIHKIESKFDTSKQKISIVQYPYLSFPEDESNPGMFGYEQFQGYLHSEHLYWSFGAIGGRQVDTWWKDLNIFSIKEQIDLLQDAGFAGLMINRNGYKDNAEDLEDKLALLLDSKPMVSENKLLSFFRLYPTGSKAQMAQTIFNSFYGWEGEPGGFRWAGYKANIVINNHKSIVNNKNISFTLGTLRDRGMMIKLNDKTLEQFEMKSGEATKHSFSLQLESGENKLTFETNKSGVTPGGDDNRELFFSISEIIYD